MGIVNGIIRRLAPSFRLNILIAVSVTATSLLLPVSAGAAPTSTILINESFRNNSATNTWIRGSAIAGTGGCLTAGNNTGSIPACTGITDTAGNGALRLTSNAQSGAGFAILNQNLPSNAGLDIVFDMFQYGGTAFMGRPGDGISFFLVDGSQNPTQPGQAGASLGYSSTPGNPSTGILGGYVGIGFDRHGNYSTVLTGSGATSNSGFPTQNNIAIRGNQASDFRFIQGVAAPQSLDDPTAVTRDPALRRVHVTLSTSQIMNVEVSYDGGATFVPTLTDIDLKGINTTPFPSSFKFGFAASTGSATNTHEIRNVTVATLAPDISTTTDFPNTYMSGRTEDLTVTVHNNYDAGPTTGTTTVTSTLPAGFTPESASGSGWSCSVNGQTVSCSTTAVIASESDAPVITVKVKPTDTAPANATFSATASTPNEQNTSDNSSSTESTKIAPDVVITTKMPSSYSPGGEAKGTISTKNQGTASTSGPVTVTATAPNGFVPQSATGNGWSCTISGQVITCVNPTIISAGASLSDIEILFKISATATGDANLTATASTLYDSNLSNNTSEAKSSSARLASTGINSVMIAGIAAAGLATGLIVYLAYRRQHRPIFTAYR